MDKADTLRLLRAVQSGETDPETALERLNAPPFEDLGYAKVDHHRARRQGVGEVVYGAGKTPEQMAGIVRRLCAAGARDVLITRLAPDAASEVAGEIAGECGFEYHAAARLGVAGRTAQKPLRGHIVVASGGTCDLAVCEEAALTAEVLGNRVSRLYDVGVAGLHRLLAKLDVLETARCVIAVAGMEGALAGVVGGLVACPVIAVPTSVGYGAAFGGVAALLSMLNSCASGVAVVNIDNGFGAGYLASAINLAEGCP